MTKEEITKAAVDYANSIAQHEHNKKYCIEDFIAGAELAYRTMIEKACEWLENNLDGYLVIEEDNYEGCVKACYIHSNVYRDFMGAMKGDQGND